MQRTIMTIEEGSTIIGIDIGTSHCTAAVWDSTRGHPKWIRLGSIATRRGGKEGRVVPSAILFATREYANQHQWWEEEQGVIDVSRDFPPGSEQRSSPIVACVGERALQIWRNWKAEKVPCATTPLEYHDDVSAALITSAKRLLGLSQVTPELKDALSMKIVEPSDNDREEIAILVRPLGYDKEKFVHITPTQATSILLQAIRQSAQIYLQKYAHKKKLCIPGLEKGRFDVPIITNAVLGVPAHYTHAQQALVVQAARMAGFTGQVVTTLIESTAAAMAYGIFVNQSSKLECNNILVFDSGGGTTDVTIATLSSSSHDTDDDSQRFRVVLTHGNPQLGGDDMDAALLTVVLNKVGITSIDNDHDRRQLLSRVRTAKERLCGDVDHGYNKPETRVTVQVTDGRICELTQDDLQKALGPWLVEAKTLVQEALQRFVVQKGIPSSTTRIQEVILVGGATRVPAVRTMLRELFPPPIPKDLCLSVDAMAAVAQGTAIQAAIQSRKIPLHEVRSAMMLDTVPHAIGILLDNPKRFVELIPRDTSLPATGSANFQLADANQPGISFTVAEDVGNQELYPKLGEFTFLLAQISKDVTDHLQGIRTVVITIQLTESGELKVSYFDENDPEHKHGMKKRQRHIQSVHSAQPCILDFHNQEERFSLEQIVLLISCIVLFFAYIAARIVFQEELAVKSG
jgi:molecular chaperone DnaK (HSP70)